MKSFESASLMKNESEAVEAASRMLKSEFSVSKVILFGSIPKQYQKWIAVLKKGASNEGSPFF
jgi:hypothetical protein